MRKNIIQEKSYLFALRIINLYKYITENKKEYVLSKQILRSKIIHNCSFVIRN